MYLEIVHKTCYRKIEEQEDLNEQGKHSSTQVKRAFVSEIHTLQNRVQVRCRLMKIENRHINFSWNLIREHFVQDWRGGFDAKNYHER